MAEAPSETLPVRRGVLARIGITLLNLLQPGLGLLRLGKVRPALGFLVAQLLGAGLLLLCYAFGPTLAYIGYLWLLAIAVVGILVLYVAAMAVTWRSSRQIEPRTGWLWHWYGVIAVWLVIGIATSPLGSVPSRYYRNFWIPAESMMPGMMVGDRFIVKMQGFSPLRRGDVVVVRRGSTEYVKRIVAIPGDRIAIEAGQIVLNGQKIEQREVGRTQSIYDGNPRTATVLEERLTGEARSHRIMDLMQTPQDDWPEQRLGPDQFVLLGDNRDNSLDSRFPEDVGGLGVVSRARIEGRALFRYWRTNVGLGEGAI